ncbi:Gfo/Idh/MocA family oxidoreductase [Lactiplantibacillus fabifermentans]|uniref:Oxidoreductase n=2 Tax=Lactiplantibacillus fabifermentans TaxID=483011 RepID=A0A0R2NE12_9LACO|nr:Gfo/Idh/MocA family oxidoreductase [Lactiplantibacillus fabifermentans]ETY73594.1 NAD(P)-dependent oxidoreductase [Lactiplantibacillus fabifermentans T30PCM01]KRO24105.1 oxidoreductase [Lactiplantibacillus fabifermentans DSM 21115]
MLTIAYIGNGKSTNRYHLPFALKLTDKIKVKTIYSRSGRQTWPVIDGVHYTTDINDIYDDPEIQLVVVSTPSHTHYQLAKDVLNHGKNVLVEKPFTETSAEAKELFALAKAKGLLIQCYQNRRYDSDFLTVQHVIESGKLGDLLELEMHFDYFRPNVPMNVDHFSLDTSYLYGHACHTLDQVISYFGRPDDVHYDVRQLLGEDRMNDYFDIDLYYGTLKVSVKSSYFRIKPRPSFIVYGKQGMFVKADKDRQETDLKHFYLPDHPDFGIDQPANYGTLTYMDNQDNYHEEKVVSVDGDYSRVYAGLYDAIINGQPKTVKDEETILQIEMLEQGIQQMRH